MQFGKILIKSKLTALQKQFFSNLHCSAVHIYCLKSVYSILQYKTQILFDETKDQIFLTKQFFVTSLRGERKTFKFNILFPCLSRLTIPTKVRGRIN